MFWLEQSNYNGIKKLSQDSATQQKLNNSNRILPQNGACVKREQREKRDENRFSLKNGGAERRCGKGSTPEEFF